MYADDFDYNSTCIIKTFTNSGLQNTKSYTTVYSGKCFAYKLNRASNYIEGGRTINEVWEIGIHPKDWTTFNDELTNADVYINGGTKPYKLENPDNPGDYGDVYLLTVYRTGTNG